MFEGASGKFARLGEAHAVNPGDGVGQRGDAGPAGMNVKLYDILAGKTRGFGKPETEPVVEQFARTRVAESRPGGAARDRAGASSERRSTVPASGPDTRNTATPARPEADDRAKIVREVISVSK